MEKKVSEQKILKWENDFGLFEATIWDGKLTDFRACESGSSPTIYNSNPDFLKEVANAINELLAELNHSQH